MNDRIIAKNRYKKVARKNFYKKHKKLDSMYNINGEYKTKKVKRESIFSLTIVKIIIVLLAIFLLSIISTIIIKNKEKVPIISVFFDSESKNLVKNYNLKIGIIENDSDVSVFKSDNLIINDTYKNLASKSLVTINEDYSINYELAKQIKREDLSYFITLDSKYKITADNVKTTIYKILSNKENIFYNKMKIVKDIKVLSEYELCLIIENNNPYFIYYLDFPIYIDEDISKNVKNIFYNANIDNNSILYKNNENNGTSVLSYITLNKYNISYSMVEDFKKNELDVMFISSDNILKLIGKYDYGMKRYRDGTTLFLFGNVKSEIFSKKEIRQSILYSINREEIIRSLNNSYLELIDLPYLYNNVISYKYDITAANNVMLSNGWKKQGGIYTKDEKQAILTLLVNSEDEVKCKVAEQIKNMVELNGIRINVEKLSKAEINERINLNKYDIVLADVVLDETPDINFLRKYIEVSDTVKEQIENINSSGLENISGEVNKLYEIMSCEVACIGIYATNTSVVYQKDIIGFENLTYLNIFKNYDSIGKVAN